MTIGSEYYVADADSASALEFTGYGEYTVKVKLSDKAVADFTAKFEEAGYDVTTLSEVLNTTAIADEFTAVLVMRGDANLDDSDKGTNDTIRILTLYNRITLQNRGIEWVQESLGVDEMTLKVMCYAADVNCDQVIDSKDANTALKYYNFNYLQQLPKTWDELIGDGNEATIHEYAQHVDPLVVFPAQ